MTVTSLWQGPETVVPNALRGYRSFRVGAHGETACLMSTGVDNAWLTSELDAACLLPSVVGDINPDCPCDFCGEEKHPAPQSDCTCGIYGWYRPDDTRLVKSNLLAVVEVSGRAVLGTHGFRAEKARIVALSFEFSRRDRGFSLSFYEDNPRTALHEIARWCKDNGVRTFATNAELIEAYPPDDVSELVWHDCAENCDAYPKQPGMVVGSSLSSSISFSIGANTAAFAKAMESASTHTYMLAAPPDAPLDLTPPRWKRLAAILLCGFVFGLTATAGVRQVVALVDHVAWTSAALLLVDVVASVMWARLGRKAWRWGR